MSVLIAVDAGGTNTRAVVLTTDGTCLARASAGSGNPTATGTEAAGANVAAAVGGALTSAGIPAAEVVRVLAAMAGASGLGTDWLAQALAPIGVQCPVATGEDLLAAFLSGTLADGYGFVSGTGAIAIRVVDGRNQQISDGIGWMLGDEGSGFWLGRELARAAAADLDGRGPATAVTPAVLAELGVERIAGAESGRAIELQRMVTAVYRLRPVEIARLAPLAFVDDPVAHEIVERAIACMSRTLAAVLRHDRPGPLVLGGSVLARQPRMAQALAASAGPTVTGTITVTDGTIGAAVMTLRAHGITVDEALARHLRASFDALDAA